MSRNEGFGLVPTSAAYKSSCVGEEGWDSGTWLDPGQSLEIPLQASVLSYGLSVFEGLKAFRTVDGGIQLYRPRDHAERFQRSAHAIGLPQLPVETFVRVCREAVQRNEIHIPPVDEGSLYIRPVLFADEARLGMGLPATARFVLFVSPVAEYFQQSDSGVRLRLLNRSRVPAGGIGYAKCSGNYSGTLLIRVEAMKEGFDDVLYSDAHDPETIAELTGANIFARLDDSLIVTPPPSDQILAGITRDSVIRLLLAKGLNVEERPLKASELLSAQEAFCTGTAWGIVGVREVQRGETTVQFRSLSISAELLSELRAIQTGRTDNPFGSERISPA